MVDTHLQTENLSACRQAIHAYCATCEDIFNRMRTEIQSLTNTNFIGDASVGYNTFFTQITPVLTKNLIGDTDSLTSMLESMLTNVEQMLNPVDPTLQSSNENAGNGGAQAVTPTNQ